MGSSDFFDINFGRVLSLSNILVLNNVFLQKRHPHFST